MSINFENAKAFYVTPQSKTVSMNTESSLLAGSPVYGDSGKTGQTIVVIGGSGEDEY